MGEFLLRRFFTPLAHWIDHRFHVNCYLVARFFFQGSALSVALWGGIYLFSSRESVWDGVLAAVVVIGAIFWLMIGIGAAEISRRASVAYENNPAAWPRDALIFVAMVASFRFLFHFVFGSILIWDGVMDAATRGVTPLIIPAQSFLILFGIGAFFGAVPPSGKPRREARSPLAPAPGSA